MRKLSILQGIVIVGILLLTLASARADKVDDLVRQLGDADYKVRLSAALNLGKIGDKRAVGPLSKALTDSDKTVRGVAAAALGKIIDAKVPVSDRTTAITALQKTSQSDGDSFVRQQAQKSYDAVKALAPGPTTTPGGKLVYIEIGPMANSTKQGGTKLTGAMRQAVQSSMSKGAPQFIASAPSASQLNGAAGAFYIDGTLVNINITQGGVPQVSCNVSLLIATLPQKSMFAFLKGGAAVDATSSSQKHIDEAAEICVGAVLEDMVATKVIPTIKSRI
jgi:hypothetical protein